MDRIEKYTTSFGLALVITSLFSAMLVVVKELSERTVLAWMKQATVHHWVTHAIMDLLVFVLLGLLLTKVKISSERLSQLILVSITVSGLIIAGFYLIEG
ncbi:MAG: hypothetical protein ABFD97_25650 [Syntrophobacter sp.]